MKIFKLPFLLACITLIQCKGQNQNQITKFEEENGETISSVIDMTGKNIASRFVAPEGFVREKVMEDSFEHYLRMLPLKPADAEVLYYDKSVKINHGVYAAVVDLAIGDKDLHQCADAVMRLRAEYLWKQKRYDDIHFHFTNGFDVPYSKWMNGYRIVIQGNNTRWSDKPKAPSNTYNDLWNYLENIFMYAGTLSLSKELKLVLENDLKIGDVFIKGGSPGHAVIIVDMVRNAKTGEKRFILAQSYMPAQELQILLNPNGDGVWFSDRDLDPLETPEWVFTRGSLKRF